MLERQGRGFDVHQRVLAGAEVVCETQRYYEYCEGSVRPRKSLESFVPTEGVRTEQFEWVESNVEGWLQEHQEEVLAESRALAARAEEDVALVAASRQLAALSETLVTGTASYEEIMASMKELGANETIDLGDMKGLSESLAQELALKGDAMTQAERDELQRQGQLIIDSVSDLAEGSAALQKLLATGSEAAEGEIARDTGNMRDDHLRHQGRQILADGKSIAAGVSSVDDAIAAIEGNPQFVEDIKALIANYVEDAVCGVQLPRIDGEKEWGTYAMMRLGIKRFTIEPEAIDVVVATGVSIAVQDIDCEFEAFDFEVDKRSFPKVRGGTAPPPPCDVNHRGRGLNPLSEIRLDRRFQKWVLERGL